MNNKCFLDSQISQSHIEYFTKLINESEKSFQDEVLTWVDFANNKLSNGETSIIEYTHMNNVFFKMITNIQIKHIEDGMNKKEPMIKHFYIDI